MILVHVLDSNYLRDLHSECVIHKKKIQKLVFSIENFALHIEFVI